MKMKVDHKKLMVMHGKMKQKKLMVKLTQIRNENNKKEWVVLLRKTPRVLDVVNFVGLGADEAIMRKSVMPGQAVDTFDRALQNMSKD